MAERNVFRGIAAIETGKFMFVVLTIVLRAMALAILHVVWKCRWKIEQLRKEP